MPVLMLKIILLINTMHLLLSVHSLNIDKEIDEIYLVRLFSPYHILQIFLCNTNMRSFKSFLVLIPGNIHPTHFFAYVEHLLFHVQCFQFIKLQFLCPYQWRYRSQRANFCKLIFFFLIAFPICL